MWRSYVFCKRAKLAGGMLDEFHMLTESSPNDLETVQRIVHRHILGDESSVVFMHHGPDGVTVGVEGVLVDTLGSEHQLAHEWRELRSGLQKGREITFVHGYVGSKGSKIPSLEELLSKHHRDISQVLERANRAETVVSKPIITAPAEFVEARTSANHGWDSIAKELESGGRLGETAVFTKAGKHLGWLSSEVSTVTKNMMAIGGKKTTPSEIPKKLAFLPVACITLGVMTAGWLALEFVKTFSNHGQKATSNQGQSRH